MHVYTGGGELAACDLGFAACIFFSLARPLPLQRLPGSQQHGGKKLKSPLGRPPKPKSDTPTHPAAETDLHQRRTSRTANKPRTTST